MQTGLQRYGDGLAEGKESPLTNHSGSFVSTPSPSSHLASSAEQACYTEQMARIAIVDEDDTIIGSEDRDVVRRKGLRHRIVRVFVVNDQGQVLLQKRNEQLQDNPGKWDQSVGGHVDAGEDYITAAARETQEELGIKVSDFVSLGKFYIERPAPGGTVRRFQTVFTCKWNGLVRFDQAEVSAVQWFTIAEIDAWLAKSPDDFTKNFKAAFDLLKQATQPPTAPQQRLSRFGSRDNTQNNRS